MKRGKVITSGSQRQKLEWRGALAKRWAPYNSRARGKVLMSVLPVPACSAVSMAIVCCLLLVSSCSRGCCLLPAPALLPLAVDLIPAPSPLTTTLLQGVASHKRGFLLHMHKRFDIWGWGTRTTSILRWLT